MSSNQREPILVSFDFENKEIRVSAFTLNGNHRDSITKPLQCFDLKDYNSMYSIEIPINHLIDPTIPHGSKWVFSWNQWSGKDQTLKLQQYVPFTTSNSLFHPSKYQPWSTLESWSYTAFPSKYTTQTNQIKHTFHPQFYKLYDLTMDVHGKPAVANWSTTNS